MAPPIRTKRRLAGFNENIVPDNRAYPIRATPGVNRGYMKGVLDDSLRLVNFTRRLPARSYTVAVYLAENMKRTPSWPNLPPTW